VCGGWDPSSSSFQFRNRSFWDAILRWRHSLQGRRSQGPLAHMSLQDSSLLDAVRGLAAQLDVTDPGLDDVGWRNVVGTARYPRVMPSDQCEFWPRQLILPAQMRDAISVDEWRPIIASELVYRKLYSKVGRKRTALLLGPLLALVVIVVVLIFITGSSAWAGLGFLYFIVIIPVLRGNTRFFYRCRLDADRTAAGVVGKEAFLEVLRKIDSLKLPEIEKSKNPGFDNRRAVNPVPNIIDRIANLEQLTTG